MRLRPAVCKVAISLRRDVARPNVFPVKPRLIAGRAWPNDLFDENRADGLPPGRAFVATERDGYFVFSAANRMLHAPVSACHLPSQIRSCRGTNQVLPGQGRGL